MARNVRRASQSHRTPRFTVGRDHHGWWVVHDGAGLVGGIFASEDAAMHFAIGECARSACKVRRAARSEVVELGGFTSDTTASPMQRQFRPDTGYR